MGKRSREQRRAESRRAEASRDPEQLALVDVVDVAPSLPEAFSPDRWRFLASGRLRSSWAVPRDELAALLELHELRRELDAVESVLVNAARARGVSWRSIGAQSGRTGEAVRLRHGEGGRRG